MAGRLAGKTALVFGAGSSGPGWGNGKAAATLFAREGARVFCVDIDQAAAQETADIICGEGGEAEAVQADASKAPDVVRTVASCLDRFGRIDVLDNNVGIAAVGGVVEVSEEAWDRVFAVNLKSCFLGMKHVIPAMERQGGGSIINISSIASIRYTGVPYTTYYASKAAMNHLTHTAAVQYAPKKIRINAILPGLMKNADGREIGRSGPGAMLEGTSRRCGERATRRCRWGIWAMPGTWLMPPCFSRPTNRGT